MKRTLCQATLPLITMLPKMAAIPYYSPACLFLETMLRSRDIPYKTQPCSIWKILPCDHLFPIVEVDGLCFRNVMACLEYLSLKYGKRNDAGLSPVERAQSIAVSALLDELTCVDNQWIADDKAIREEFTYFQLYVFRSIIVKRMKKKMKRRMRGYGLGGSTASEEVTYRTEVMMEALSGILGSDKYFFGVDTPSWLDCKVFAVLAQFKYTPVNQDAQMKQFMRERTPNLMTFIRRMKEDFWADWDDTN